MKVKKLIALGIAVSMSLSVLAGCGADTKEDSFIMMQS